jgi:integral membrane protein
MAQPAGPPVTGTVSLRRRLSDLGLAGALLRYRVMAYVVGVGLAILVFVGIPLQIAGHKIVVELVGPFHGFLYIVYLIFALDLARRARFTVLQMAAMIGAGLLPGLAFVIERKVTARVEAGEVAPWTLPKLRRRSA